MRGALENRLLLSAKFHEKRNMDDTFRLRVLTPSGAVLDEIVSSAKVPTTEGEIGVLPRHCTYVGLLGTGQLSYISKGKEEKITVSNGSVQFDNDTLTILADEAR
jgi:F-type H+-transporting ATPase subunit epsilon